MLPVVSYEIEVSEEPGRRTLVASAVTTWAEHPSVWPAQLDAVWTVVRSEGLAPGSSMMLYLDDRPAFEVGVLLPGGDLDDLAATAVVDAGLTVSTLPVGRAVSTTHRGPYGGLRDAHDAIHAWAAAHDERLSRVRWEIHGDHADDPAHLETDVTWLLA